MTESKGYYVLTSRQVRRFLEHYNGYIITKFRGRGITKTRTKRLRHILRQAKTQSMKSFIFTKIPQKDYQSFVKKTIAEVYGTPRKKKEAEDV